jgi:predicted amidohydrolase
MQVACCQFDIAWEDKPANYRRVQGLVREAKLEAGALLLLPEMFATGFSMNVERTAEPPDGPTVRFLSELAAAQRLHVIGGVAIADPARGGRPCNEAVAVDPSGKVVKRYAKVYPFSPGTEDKHYAAGTEPVDFDWSGCRIAPTVCYDLRFPELFRRAMARSDRAVELMTVIANWPVARIEHWMALLRARAIENQAYVAGCNRVGKDPALVYNGRSQIIDPSGTVLADAGGEETVIRASLDLANLRSYRQKLPFLSDMRMNG